MRFCFMYRNKTFNRKKVMIVFVAVFYYDVSDWKTGLSDDILLRILWK